MDPRSCRRMKYLYVGFCLKPNRLHRFFSQKIQQFFLVFFSISQKLIYFFIQTYTFVQSFHGLAIQ